MVQRSVYIETYGCQMNVADTELIAGVLKRSGYRTTPEARAADVILVNTCAVREHAEERVMGRLAELHRFKLRRPDLVLGVCGCMAKHLGEVIAKRAPYVDLVVGPDSYRRLPDLLDRAAGEEALLDLRLDRDELYAGLDPVRGVTLNALKPLKSNAVEPVTSVDRKGSGKDGILPVESVASVIGEGVSAWVTIMRGCDKFCTFCIVPYVRGREKSVPPDEIVRQVEALASEGYKEVTLLGQTVNSYRWDGADFADLLERVSRVEGIERIRFTAPHPSDFSEKLIETIAGNPKVCKHLHLPVQSGSDRVLRAMRRTYTAGEYLALVERIRGRIPGVGLTTDVIVGFPGEGETDFQATCDLMEAVRYDSAFVFKYSPREGTVAYREMPDDVPDAEKGRRLQALIALQEAISWGVNRALVGRTVRVLVEGQSKRDKAQLYGKTNAFKTVVLPDRGERPGALVDVEIVGATSHTLMGGPLDKSN